MRIIHLFDVGDVLYGSIVSAMMNGLKPVREFIYKLTVERVDVDVILLVLPADKRLGMLVSRFKALIGALCVIFSDQGFHPVVVLLEDQQHLSTLIFSGNNVHQPGTSDLCSGFDQLAPCVIHLSLLRKLERLMIYSRLFGAFLNNSVNSQKKESLKINDLQAFDAFYY